MENFFVVLGGMGTMATESFVRLLNQRTPAQCDQDYLNYLVVNHATIPDRTAYILKESDANPLEPLMQDIQSLSTLHPKFFVMTCNTAHHFYDQLQAVTDIPIIHMPKLAAQKIAEYASGKPYRVMILATSGTIASKVYHKQFDAYDNIEVVIPDADLQKEVMDLIYHDIKEHDFYNEKRYREILRQSKEKYQCDGMILGCTELSLMEEYASEHPYKVVDAQSELVDKVLTMMNK